MKNRMGLLDLRVQTAKVNASLRGARVVNVYDAHNGRTYILKLSVPPVRSDPSASASSLASSTASSYNFSHHASWEKRLLLIESGVRVHMTQFDREKDVPSGFCLKLRKHIRTRRLEAVRQLGDGGDRIIDLVFSGEGSVCAHLIVEAFAGGNVILTDSDYTILTLLRTYRLNNTNDPSKQDDDPTRVAVRERYPIENARMHTDIQLNDFIDAGKSALEDLLDSDVTTTVKPAGRAARRKLYARGIARKALAVKLSIEPTLLEHALLTAGFSSDTPLRDVCANDFAGLHAVYEALANVEAELNTVMKRGEMKGYIVASTIENSDSGKTIEKYEEFAPYLFAQYKGKTVKEFASFDEAADEFFARLESERVEASQAKREAAAFKKVDKLELELSGQVTAFESARDNSWEMAQAIESNITEVEAAITVIRSAIAAAVQWDGLAKMVQDERRNGNPVAEIIHSLQLEKNQITLMLEDTFGTSDDNNDDGDEDDDVDVDNDDDDINDEDEDDEDDDDDDDGDDDDDDDCKHTDKTKRKKGANSASRKFLKSTPESRKAMLVPVDISLSAYANARRHYEMRKNAAAKMEKAAEVKDRTIKAASKKATNEAQKLEQEAVAASIRARRKALWFEKFYWFVSSENFLVVAGRDAQQNDLLVKRYLGPADVYVNADVEGASSVIVKNQKLNGAMHYTTDIPNLTLEQAGTFAMCRSAAWESKIVTSAWWVRASQVSKTTSTGQYLPPGNFAIRGKKNFLNPTQLIMGLAFLFKVDEESAQRHKGERCVRGLENKQTTDTDNAITRPQHIENDTRKPIKESPNNSFKRSEIRIDEVSLQKLSISKEMDSRSESVGVTTSPSISEQLSSDINNINLNASPRSSIAKSTVEEMNDNIENNDSQQQTGKKRLSAKEKKAQKNSKSRKKGNNTTNSNEDQKKDQPQPNAKDEGKVKTKGGNPLPRGKKHKLKKMKKYMDQDEEERRIALAVLGSKPIKQEQNQLNEVKEAGDEMTDISADPETNVNDDEDDDNSNNDTRTKRIREPRQEELLMMDEEGVMELERLEADTTSALQLFTGIPTEEDTVEFALPVCAPLQAVSQYRYRTKLMPGNMKRGKAYRAAVVLFQKQAEKDLSKFKQERDAIRTTPESDGIHNMLGNVKIMAPGLADAQKALSKTQKALSKAKKGVASGKKVKNFVLPESVSNKQSSSVQK